MFSSLIYSIIYIVAELFPFSGDAHIKLYSYYFSKPDIDEFTYKIIIFSLITGIIIFFIKDLFFIFKESFKAINNLRTGRSSFETVVLEYKLFNVFVFLVFISLVYFLIFNYFNFILDVNPDKHLLSFFLIVSAAVLFVSRYFTVVKVFPYLFNIKELVLFSILCFVCIIPGLSRVALMLGFANMLGFEKKYAYRFTLLSLLIYLFFNLFNKTNFDYDFFYLILESKYIFIFLFNVVLVLFILKIFYFIISNVRVSRFYIYLLVLGLWTILDLYFSKRGL